MLLSFLMLRRSNVSNLAKPTLANCPTLTNRLCSTRACIIGTITFQGACAMVELIWDGKYDSNGKRTSPPRLKLPFQTVETINESAQQRQLSLDMFSAGKQSDWRNRLIWGDKKYVLPALS